MNGFIRIRTIIIAVVIILILSFLSFDIQSFVEAPQTQANLHYVWSGIVFVWEQYLENPATYIWSDIFVDLLWNSFVGNLQDIQSGQGNSFQQMGEAMIPFPNN